VLDEANSEFDRYKHQFLEGFWQLSPEYALCNGRYEFADALTVYNDKYWGQEKTFVQHQQKRLASLTTEYLNQTNKGDAAIIANQLATMDWYRETFREQQWNPALYNIAGPVGLILNTDYTSLSERLLAISARLQRVSDYYTAAQANISNPALPQTLLAIEQNKGALNLLQGRLADVAKNSDLSQVQRDKLLRENNTTANAVADYISFLESLLPTLQTANARDFRIGETLYEAKFRFDIGSEFSAR
jgi:hypothetical protein